MIKVSVYNCILDKYFIEDITEVIKEIKNGEHKNLVEEIRNLSSSLKFEQADSALNRLPWFIPAGVLNEELCGDMILEYSGLVAVEVVDVYSPDAQELIDIIESITTTYCWFQSVDPTRITILVAVNSDSMNHEIAFLQVAEFYSKALGRHILPEFRYITKPVFFSYSPLLYHNPNCESFNVRKDYEMSNYFYCEE